VSRRAPEQHRDPGGPLVTVCAGHRCAALRRLAGTPEGVDDLCAAVRSTAGAVLVTAPCVGACARGAVVAVAHRPAGSPPGPNLWLGGAQTPQRTAALAAWVRAGGPGGTGDPVPAGLVDAVACVGPPSVLVPRESDRTG